MDWTPTSRPLAKGESPGISTSDFSTEDIERKRLMHRIWNSMSDNEKLWFKLNVFGQAIEQFKELYELYQRRRKGELR